MRRSHEAARDRRGRASHRLHQHLRHPAHPGSEPLSGGERNAAFTVGRVAEAAASVGAHIVLGATSTSSMPSPSTCPARSARSRPSPQARCPRTATSGSAPRSPRLWTRSPGRPLVPSGTWSPPPPPARTRRGPRDRGRRLAADRAAGRRAARGLRHKSGRRPGLPARELADPVRGRGPGYRDPGPAGGWAGLGRAAPGPDRRAATGPLRSAGRADKGSGQGVHGLDGTTLGGIVDDTSAASSRRASGEPHSRTAGGPR